MTRFMQSKHLVVVAACICATTLATSPAAAQQPDFATINGTFNINILDTYGQIAPDLAAIVARGESHTWTLTLHGLSYSHDDEIVDSDPQNYYARSNTHVYASSFEFQFHGPDADALNAIVSDRLVNGGLQDEPFVELRNVTYWDADWGWLAEARDWWISVKPLDYQQGFWFYSYPASLEYPPYTEDANGYPVLEPFTNGFWGAGVNLEDRRSGDVSSIGGATTVSVSSVGFSLPGDIDGEGDVDGRDFLIWQRGGSPNPLSASDLADWQANYGTGPPIAGSVAIPEPGTQLLASALAVLSLLFQKRRLARGRASARPFRW